MWAVGYWIVYPAWPTLNGYTKGMFGYSQRDVVRRGNRRCAGRRKASIAKSWHKTPLDRSSWIPTCYRFAMAAGAAAFQNNCAPCHGRGAQGFIGYPNLNDDDWLWGGTIEDIHKTISFGIRTDTRRRAPRRCPASASTSCLPEAEIDDVGRVCPVAVRKSPSDPAAVAQRPKDIRGSVRSCHGADGKGKQEQGAPNLTDPIWLYGDSRAGGL